MKPCSSCLEKQQEIDQLKEQLAKAEKYNKQLLKKTMSCYLHHSPPIPEHKASVKARRERTTARSKAKAQVKQAKKQS